MNINIVKIERNHIRELQELLNLFADAFDWSNFQSPDEKWLLNLLDNSRFYVFAAIAEQKLIGGLTAYSLQQYYTATELVYVYDLAVAQTWRRRGVGKMLMNELFNFCKSNQIYEVFVQADEEDAEAITFYQSIGPFTKKAMDFTFHLSKY